MRELGEFIRIRAAKMGFSSADALADAADMARQTVYGFYDAKTPDDVGKDKHLTKREGMATALKFYEWKTLVAAWEKDELLAELPISPKILRDTLRTLANLDEAAQVAAMAETPEEVLNDIADIVTRIHHQRETDGKPSIVKFERARDEKKKIAASTDIPPKRTK